MVLGRMAQKSLGESISGYSNPDCLSSPLQNIPQDSLRTLLDFPTLVVAFSRDACCE
jgi:hypothetical protein